MQNKYVGDIGDFGKYGLLRALCGVRQADPRERLSLGVVWYFVGDRGVDYLNKPDRFKDCDARLFDMLEGIVAGNQRNVDEIASSEMFPEDTVFFKDPVNVGRREAWLDRALQTTDRCDLVFFDPDNGLKNGSVPDRGVSSKHIYLSEVKPFVDRGQSVIIYHHIRSPRGGVPAHIAGLADDLRDGVASRGEVWALLHQRYTLRTYFIIPNPRNTGVLGERVDGFLGGPWGQSRSRRKKPDFERIV
jgi:hypothetical protein